MEFLKRAFLLMGESQSLHPVAEAGKENKQIDISLIKPLLSCRKDRKIRKLSHY